MMRYAMKALSLVVLATTVAAAQEPGRGRRGQPRDSARGGPGLAAARQAIEKAIRAQLQPTEEQMARLRQVDQQFVPRRLQLEREEMQTRRELRQAMLDSTNLNEGRIGQLLDRMVTYPGRRAALMEEEQKALAQFLSPIQRAKFNAIQEQLRRRIEQGRGGSPGRGRPPQQPVPAPVTGRKGAGN
jgi:Spy/CpxP family protein refolding chaperone